MKKGLRWGVGLLLVGHCLLDFSPVQAQSISPEQQISDAVYLNQTARDLYLRGESEDAIATYQEALAAFRALNALAGAGNSLNGIGEVYLTLGDIESAIAHFQEALDIFQRLDEQLYVAYSWQFLGDAHHAQHNYHDAGSAYLQALQIFQNLQKTPGQDLASLQTSAELTLTEIGAVRFKLGQYEDAIAAYQEVLDIQAVQTDKIGTAYTLNNLGVIYANQSRYQEALNTYLEALAIVQELAEAGVRYLGEEAAILNNLSALFFSLGDRAQALDYAQKANQLYEQWQNSSTILPQPQELELLRDAIGRLNWNAQVVQQNYAIRPPLSPEFNTDQWALSTALNATTVAQLHQSQGDLTQALRLYQRALKLYQTQQQTTAEALTLSNISQVYILQADLPSAIAFAEQALQLYEQLNDPVGIARVQVDLAQIYQVQGEPKKAQDWYKKSLNLQQAISGDRATLAFTLRQLGALQLEQGQLTDAIATLNQAIAVQEALRVGLSDANKVNLFEQGKVAYQDLQAALVQSDRLAEALIIAERSRARAFVELLADPNRPTTVEPITLPEIQAIAHQERAVLVEYSLIRDRDLYIWVIQPTGEIAFRQVALGAIKTEPGEAIASIISRSRRSIVRGRPSPAQSESLQGLYELLITPIADLLPQEPNSAIILVPQAELFLIPFAALLDTTGEPLIRRYTIQVTPSLQALSLLLKQAPRSSARPLIVGNPTMPAIATKPLEPPTLLTPLPGAEMEANSIAQLLQTTPFLGDTATESRITQHLPGAQIVHLATHGILDEIRFWSATPGAIALAPDEQADGLLTPNEILALSLQAELIVLSACNTGLGRLTGDGVVGLSRAFLGAGAKSAIVSLWAVPDQPTAFLMSEFYREWQQSQNKAQALQQAMLKTREQYPNPQDWAGFFLVGVQ